MGNCITKKSKSQHLLANLLKSEQVSKINSLKSKIYEKKAKFAPRLHLEKNLLFIHRMSTKTLKTECSFDEINLNTNKDSN